MSFQHDPKNGFSRPSGKLSLLPEKGRSYGFNHLIANTLMVARGTIKAQAVSIFRKLDVANRTMAVARARQLGILP